ncbi:MAG: 4Fe-4S binding protein [Gammaproteobacteria bacterium]|nr:4Fe-4S binding protein [Gammaproteobacteria bacterium]MDD9895545.1 4Fe-4S binding protein [Gammaproteobacteria bacterium]MDD9958469.1 4Fe-4S binding protein [Gammaproteobacteria bacterium]
MPFSITVKRFFQHCFISVSTLILSVLTLIAAAHVSAQPPIEVTEEILREVFPEAEQFTPKEGAPPVYKALRENPESNELETIGYLFETPDLPPEEIGYSAPIDVLVGMDLRGTLTGIKILHYIESYRSIRGDFINSEYFPDQFEDKNIVEGFRIGRDVDGISRATITAWAVSRGVRNAARRIAESYLSDSEFVALTSADAVALQVLAGQSWEDMEENGLVVNWAITQPDGTELHLALAFIGHDGLGELLVGEVDYSRADREASARVRDGNMLLVGIDGNSSQPFRQERLAVQQGEAIYPIERRRFVYVGSADYGKIADQVRFAGAMVLDPNIDLNQPFEVLYNTGGRVGEFGTIARTSYQVPQIPLALATGQPIPPELLPEYEDDLTAFQNEGLYASLINDAPWMEVAILLVLLAMVMTAFLRKSAGIRWATLVFTLVYLGFMDGGFVSVSHITNFVKIGPSMFRSDLPQLLIIVFTVVTTLFWGRVFCSSLCPFGALQDFIAHLTPRHFQKELPAGIHDKAIYIKYLVLAFLIIMAISFTNLSLFQYFEPFGTIFYFSQSYVLWGILAAFILASIFVSRFYCRYACPLGAALGVMAFVSPWRIKRVPQCDVCKVCEHSCPTGAIRGPKIDFKECVRCDICESKLIARSGVCQHDMETVKVRIKHWDALGAAN